MSRDYPAMLSPTSTQLGSSQHVSENPYNALPWQLHIRVPQKPQIPLRSHPQSLKSTRNSPPIPLKMLFRYILPSSGPPIALNFSPVRLKPITFGAMGWGVRFSAFTHRAQHTLSPRNSVKLFQHITVTQHVLLF